MRLSHSRFEVELDGATARMVLDPAAERNLKLTCSACSGACEHLGAAVSLVLEEKLALGLAAPPPEKPPVESLAPAELIEQALSERRERAEGEKLRLKSSHPAELWTDYTVTSYSSGKTYRVALRGWERGESYCDCPDFKRNTLGTCKHIMYALARVQGRFSARVRSQPYRRRHLSLVLRYGRELELWLLLPDSPLERRIEKIVSPFANRPIDDVEELLRALRKLESASMPITVYPDAQEHVSIISEGTLEEQLLDTLSAKHELALAALDPETQLTEVQLESGMEELRRRLEVLLGVPANAPVDERTRQSREADAAVLGRRRRVAAAGGQLLASAFAFMAEMLPRSDQSAGAVESMSAELGRSLKECLEPAEGGGVQLTVAFPDEQALDNLASALAAFLASRRA